MHLMPKCILATQRVHFPLENVQHHILRSKMFSITFSKGKCSASHFPKENVQHHIFLWKMFSITFSKGKCSVKQNVRAPRKGMPKRVCVKNELVVLQEIQVLLVVGILLIQRIIEERKRNDIYSLIYQRICRKEYV